MAFQVDLPARRSGRPFNLKLTIAQSKECPPGEAPFISDEKNILHAISFRIFRYVSHSEWLIIARIIQ